jgi:CheY-like chemotaxis protein
MPDDLSRLPIGRKPTPALPLMGITILAVEDSRFACEALRLLAMRSGARLRRADCLASARRHLASYRPIVVMIDLGLPDGSGLELISELDASPLAPQAVIAISGDDGAEAEAMGAGAHGFLAKPVSDLAAFQGAILPHLPEELRPDGPRLVPDQQIVPDRFALKDDLSHAAEVLGGPDAPRARAYAAQFVASLARASGDADLAHAAKRLAGSTEGDDVAVGRLTHAVQTRIAECRPI